MSEQTLPAVVEKAHPVPMARIECGCGFSAEGFDESCNAEVFGSHVCFQELQPEQYPWHESVFSVWGLLIALVVVSGVAGWRGDRS